MSNRTAGLVAGLCLALIGSATWAGPAAAAPGDAGPAAPLVSEGLAPDSPPLRDDVADGPVGPDDEPLPTSIFGDDGAAAVVSAAGAPKTVDAVGDGDRYANAVAVSQAGWPGGADTAVLASGGSWPDLASGAALAGALRSPLLLTPPEGLHPLVASELVRLAPKRELYVLGAAATPEVLGGLQALQAGAHVVVGPDALGTAVAAAQAGRAAGGDTTTVYLVVDPVGAVAASALAARQGSALLPVPAGGAGLAEAVAALGATKTLAFGSPEALSDQTLAGLPEVFRVHAPDASSGPALTVAAADLAFVVGMQGPTVLVGDGGLAAGFAAAAMSGPARNAPVLVTSGFEVDAWVGDWLAARQPGGHVTVVGGTGEVSEVARCQIATGERQAWRCAEEELARQGYHVGDVDGADDTQAVFALYAFQKVAGLPVNGRYDEGVWQALMQRIPLPEPRFGHLEGDRIEAFLDRQLLLVVRDGRTVHVVHTSSGKSSTPTIEGVFRFYEKRNYRQSDNMYRPSFFIRGYAIHGYPSVPLYPASHGCLRVYDGDMDFLWPMIWIGEQIAVS